MVSVQAGGAGKRKLEYEDETKNKVAKLQPFVSPKSRRRNNAKSVSPKRERYAIKPMMPKKSTQDKRDIKKGFFSSKFD